MGKRQTVVNTTILTDAYGHAIGASFVVPGVGQIHAYLAGFAPAIQSRMAVHGLMARYVDRAAISRDENGKPATPAEKFAAMRELHDHYMTGTDQWSMVASGGGVRGGLLYRAMQRIAPDSAYVATPAAFAEWVEEKARDADVSVRSMQAKLRADPTVASVIRDIEAEDGDDKSVDTGALLAQLKS